MTPQPPPTRSAGGPQATAPRHGGPTRERFAALADRVCAPRTGIDRILLYLSAETSLFLRFNRSRLRQATDVAQCQAVVSLVRGRKRLDRTLSLAMAGSAAVADAAAEAGVAGGAETGVDADAAALLAALDAMQAELDTVPDDPHLLLPDAIASSDRDEDDTGLPSAATVIAAAAAAPGLVGFHAAGLCVRAFADSRGQRNWHRVASFHFEWSLYSEVDPTVRDKAVKTTYAGRLWSDRDFAHRMDEARERLARLATPNRALAPGRYRALLAPPAVAELLSGLAWSGFGLKDRRTGTSSLTRLAQGAARMSPRVALRESIAAGTMPTFTRDGFALAPDLLLVDAGAPGAALVSPRSAAEYGLAPNASGDETPHSLALAPGDLPQADALQALGTGVLIGNFWYLNYSDRPACRMTGMTRFATFWVEDGRLVAPIGVMRFDDDVIALFGERLERLTDRAEFMPSGDTWGERHLGSVTCPGMLLAGLDLTL